MTVSRHRRRMTTTRALAASLVGVALAGALGATGYVAILNTTDGEVLGGAPEVTFPATTTASIAVVDDGGELASLAVVAVRPGDGDESGRGGTIVPIPISADASGGFGHERLPLAETVSLFGTDSLDDEISALLGLGIDEQLVVGRDELADLLGPLGPVSVELPSAVSDAAGTEIAAAGAQTLAPDVLAAVLATTSPSLSGADRYPVDVAVWSAVADAIGPGLANPLGVASGPGTTVAADMATTGGGALARLSLGPIAVQPLRSTPIVSVDANPRGVDSAALDRAEVLLVFGHIAPSRVAAPNAGYNFRIVSRFGNDQLPSGIARLDVAYTAIRALLGSESNVISVETAGGEVGGATVVEVNDETLVAAAATLSETFGPVEVRVAGTRIAGIDVVVTLGTDYLTMLDTSAATTGTAAGTGTSAPTAPDGDETTEGTG